MGADIARRSEIDIGAAGLLKTGETIVPANAS